MAGRGKREGEKNQNENTRRGNNGIRVHEHACSALISRGYYRAPIVWRKNNGGTGGRGKSWMTDAGKNRETGKGGADRPLFFVETRNRGQLNNRGNRLSKREGYCVSGNQRGPGNCARDVSFFNSVSKGGWVWCAVFEEDGGKTRRCRRFGRRIEGISVGESRELCRNYCVYDIYAGRWAKWLVDFFWRDECDDNWMDFCLMKKCGIV